MCFRSYIFREARAKLYEVLLDDLHKEEEKLFKEWTMAMESIREGKQADHVSTPGYTTWRCKISDPECDSKFECKHPIGYHEWIEKNPWIHDLKILRK